MVIEALVPMPIMCPKISSALSMGSSAVHCTGVHVNNSNMCNMPIMCPKIFSALSMGSSAVHCTDDHVTDSSVS